ncbi:hypothetical protein KYB31_15655 [Clostridium felsineum]|uniref:hypothetical protein n=1 Tax=Clostridium felsineum TaxID=36839 RepID=UPI00214D8CE9|nr:hypothetical protein [Clostridium felsineum]MCR3760413.1 hypothetical protein [Clostridium felsineum]
MKIEEKANYLIWIKGGSCIEGIAKINILKDLKERFQANKKFDKIVSFKDAEGEITINTRDIQAIAINNIVKNPTAGFINDK